MEEIRIELIEFLGEKEAKDLVLHLAKYLKDMNKAVDESSNKKNVTRTGDVSSGLKAERSAGNKIKPNNNNNNNNNNNSKNNNNNSSNNRGAGSKSHRNTIDDEDLEDFKRRRIGDGNTKKKVQHNNEVDNNNVKAKPTTTAAPAMPLPMALPGVGVDPEVYRQQMNTLAQMQGFESVEDMVAFQKQSLLMMQRTLGTGGRGGRTGGRIFSRGGRGEYGGRGRGRGGRSFVAPIKKEDAEYTRPPTVEHGLSASRAVVYKRNTDFSAE